MVPSYGRDVSVGGRHLANHDVVGVGNVNVLCRVHVDARGPTEIGRGGEGAVAGILANADGFPVVIDAGYGLDVEVRNRHLADYRVGGIGDVNVSRAVDEESE